MDLIGRLPNPCLIEQHAGQGVELDIACAARGDHDRAASGDWDHRRAAGDAAFDPLPSRAGAGPGGLRAVDRGIDSGVAEAREVELRSTGDERPQELGGLRGVGEPAIDTYLRPSPWILSGLDARPDVVEDAHAG